MGADRRIAARPDRSAYVSGPAPASVPSGHQREDGGGGDGTVCRDPAHGRPQPLPQPRPAQPPHAGGADGMDDGEHGAHDGFPDGAGSGNGRPGCSPRILDQEAAPNL
jgi:hypothetical protein